MVGNSADRSADIDADPALESDRTTPGIRALRKAATRRRLSISALELFAEKGFDKTSVAEIAAHAQVSERAFFLHFPTKADALFDLSPVDYDELRAYVLREPDTLSDYDLLCHAMVAFLQERGDPEFLHRQANLLARSAASSSVLRGKQFDENETMVACVMNALASRHGRRTPNLHDQVVAVVVIRVLHVSYMEWAEAEPGSDFRALATAKFNAARKALGG